MAKNAKREAAIPNPALTPLSVLVGEWDTVGTHPSLPDALHGYTSFEWFEGGAFLKMVWELSEDDSTWKRDLELTYTRVK